MRRQVSLLAACQPGSLAQSGPSASNSRVGAAPSAPIAGVLVRPPSPVVLPGTHRSYLKTPGALQPG